MTHFFRRELQTSASHLSKVSCSSVFFDKSVFFSALGNSFVGEYAQACTILDNYLKTSPNSQYNELLSVKFAGLSLLERDFEMFDYYSKQFNFEHSHFAASQNTLMNARHELANYREKSPLLAGVFSAIVPGTGKIYAGKTGEGISALASVGIFTAITAENWIKNGLTNWKTITFGTIASIFYIGNIVGSVVTVKAYRIQFNDKQNNAILLGIHIPVRAVFN